METSGNSCLFCLFKTCSIALFLVGLLDAGAGTAVCAMAETFSWYNGAFIILGVVLLGLAVFAFTTRYSSSKIMCYLILLAPCFLAQVGFTIGIFVYTDYSDEVNGEVNAHVLQYILLAACAVVLACMILGWCYRSSLQSARFYSQLERDHHFVPKAKRKKTAEGPSHYDRIKGDLAY